MIATHTAVSIASLQHAPLSHTTMNVTTMVSLAMCVLWYTVFHVHCEMDIANFGYKEFFDSAPEILYYRFRLQMMHVQQLLSDRLSTCTCMCPYT